MQTLNHTYTTRLVAGHAYKGGVARDTLAAMLHGGVVAPARDLDWIAVGVSPKCSETEYVESLEDYFSQRDFTVNEVALFSDEIVASDACMRDMRDGVVRLSANEQLRDRTIVRGLLFSLRMGFKLDAELQDGVSSLDAYGWNTDTFNIAICVLKAAETGVVDRFCKVLGIDNAREYVLEFGPRDADMTNLPADYSEWDMVGPKQSGMGRRTK